MLAAKLALLTIIVESGEKTICIVALGLGVGLVLFAIGYSLTAGALNDKLKPTGKRNGANQEVDSQK